MYINSKFKDGYEIQFHALDEELALDSFFDDCPKQIEKDIEKGNLVVFCAKVVALKKGIVLAEEYLSQCIYEDYTAFFEEEDGYFDDMLDNVVVAAKDTLKSLLEN